MRNITKIAWLALAFALGTALMTAAMGCKGRLARDIEQQLEERKGDE